MILTQYQAIFIFLIIITDKWQWLYKKFILSMLTEDKNKQGNRYRYFMGLDVFEELDLFYSKNN